MKVPLIRAGLFLLGLSLAVGEISAQPADDPEFNGRRGSEWAQLLKTDSSARKRKAAVVALGQLWADGRYSQSISNISTALQQDPSADVRLQAAVILGQITKEDLSRREDARPVLGVLIVSLQTEKDSAVRREAATALGRFGELSKPAVLALTSALKDTEPGTRAAAADSLGRIGPDAKSAAVALLPLLKDAEKPVQRSAVFALGRIAPEDLPTTGTALAGMLKIEKEAEMRKELVVALGLLGDHSPAVVEVLAATLTDTDADLRRQACRALAGFGLAVQPAVPALLHAFQTDTDKNVRIDALRTLGTSLGTGLQEHIPLLLARLNVDADASPKGDADFEVRIAITDEIGALGAAGKPAVPGLRRSLRDPQVKVREAASSAIKKIEKPIEKKP